MIIAGLRGGEVTESQTHNSGTGCHHAAHDLFKDTVAVRLPFLQRDGANESFHVQCEKQSPYRKTHPRV
jgi:hypothetical protein